LPISITRSAYAGRMSRGRHAKPRPARSDVPALLLVTLLAVGVGVAAVLFDEASQLRWVLVGLAALIVIAVFVIQRSTRRHVAAASAVIDSQQAEIRTLTFELRRLHEMHDLLATELVGFREEMARYVAPVPTPPDPVYPSLHLPLVRAAFATEVPSVQITPAPPPVRGESNRVNVDADAGSDPRDTRQLLDLTASEIARLRRAN